MTDRWVTHALKILMVIVLAIYVAQFVFSFLERIRAVIYILVGAIFLAYLIYPAVRRLQRRMPPIAAILLVYAGIAVILVAAVWFIAPRVGEDIQLFIQRYPDFAARVDQVVNNPSDPVISQLPDWMRHEIARAPAELALWARVHGFEYFGRVVFVLMGTFAAVATFVIVPLVTAYLLLDLENLKADLSTIVPADRWRTTLELLSEFDEVIGGFIRGQLLVALSVGVLITIALLLLHVRYAFLLGLLAAVGDLIPYVGAVLAFVPAFLTAYLGNGLVNAVIVAIAFILIFEAEGHLIAPNIVGKTVRLSPLVVVLALLIGAELGGLVGMLMSVPITGVLRVVALRVFRPKLANPPEP